jgi:hypothetical protein
VVQNVQVVQKVQAVQIVENQDQAGRRVLNIALKIAIAKRFGADNQLQRVAGFGALNFFLRNGLNPSTPLRPGSAQRVERFERFELLEVP